MSIHPQVTLLVRNVEKTAEFYEKSLGYDLVWDSLLLGPYGQSLRLLEVSEEVKGGGVALNVQVPDIQAAAEAIIAHGGAKCEGALADQDMYTGLNGELIRLSPRGIPGASRIRLVIYDFDGVMTDNRVFVDQKGVETVAAHRGDGMGIGIIRRLGMEQCIVSTERNDVVQARAKKIGIEAAHGVADKSSLVIQLAASKGLALSDVLFMGNDVNDAGAMGVCGFRAAPSDSHPSILAMADYVTEATGGHGCIRELADALKASVRAEKGRQE